MAKFCPNCGNPVEEGAVFCDGCGARLEVRQDGQTVRMPQPAQPPQPAAQPAAQQPAPPQVQPAAGQHGYAASPAPAQPAASQYGYAVPPQEPGRRGPRVALIGAGVAVAVVALVLIVMAVVRLSQHRDEPVPTEVEIAAEPSAETPAEVPAEEPAESTETPAEPPAEEPAPPAEAPEELPYANGIGAPTAADFAWIADAQGGNLAGSFLGVDDLVGTWKGEIVYDGAWELAYVTIYRDASIIIEPYQINYGDGWEDEAGEEPYVFDGAFDISSVNGAGTYGSINLYTFLESGGTQYGVGTFSVNNSSSADVYLVRP